MTYPTDPKPGRYIQWAAMIPTPNGEAEFEIQTDQMAAYHAAKAFSRTFPDHPARVAYREAAAGPWDSTLAGDQFAVMRVWDDGHMEFDIRRSRHDAEALARLTNSGRARGIASGSGESRPTAVAVARRWTVGEWWLAKDNADA